MMVHERLGRYISSGVHSVDFRRSALEASGRARHVVARALERMAQPDANLPEVARLLEEADAEMAVTQRILLGKIETNDKGEKV